MDLPGIKNSTGMLLDAAECSAQGTRLQALADKQSESQESREGLVKAAQEFEGVFLNTLMKAMRQTVPDNKLFNSSGPTKFYQQMHDTEIAKALATGHSGMGVADLIIRQFETSVENPTVAGEVPEMKSRPLASPSHPPLGPPAPQALERYHSMSSVGEIMASRQKLRFYAARQGSAVADTLAKFEKDVKKGLSFTATGIFTFSFTAFKVFEYIVSTSGPARLAFVGM